MLVSDFGLGVSDSRAPLLGATSTTASAPRPPQCYVVMVGGLPGHDMYARRYRDWLKRFHAHLTAAGVPKENIVVLTGDEGFKDPIVTGPATKESIPKAIETAGAKTQPRDQFILIIVGHGVGTQKVPTLALRGQDVTAEDIGKALETVAAENQVVLNFSACSGSMVSFLARPGRVNVAATSPKEGGEAVYAEFFLRGMESKRADGEGAPDAGSKDGVVTVLEAYNWAAFQVAEWVARQEQTDKITGAGPWRVNGRESVEVFLKLYKGPADSPVARELSTDSDATRPDEIVQLRPENKTVTGKWTGRRVLTEHAVLEDCGAELPVSCLGEEGYKPLAGREEGEPGRLARRVVLGEARLLAPPPATSSAPATRPASAPKGPNRP